MLYVVDIFDQTGARIHRVSGQITAGGSLSDPWANIKDTGVVRQAAQETIDALGNWAQADAPRRPASATSPGEGMKRWRGRAGTWRAALVP